MTQAFTPAIAGRHGIAPPARRWLATGLAAIAIALAFGAADSARAAEPADYAKVLEDYLAERGEAEHISGIAAYVSLGDPGPGIEVFAGTTTRGGDAPMAGDTLFQMGSNTKGFTGALILALEAQGKLSIDDTVGDWLPLYPAWKDVTIRQLLNMTAPIPTYSENLVLSRLWVVDPGRHYSLQELIDFAYPSETVNLPTPEPGWFYSNTNYILAGMIAEKASGMSYRQGLENLLFGPAGLSDTHYRPLAYPDEILDRMAGGYFVNPDCGLYEPDCKEAVLAPLIGQDVRTHDLSWAGPAGGIVANPRELARWIRAVFAGRVLPPKQVEEFLSLVSTKSGEAIADVTPDDPRGFSLGLVRILPPGMDEPLWFYQGETLGYRTAFIFSPEKNVLVAAGTNSQPAGSEDRMVPMVMIRLFQLATGG